MVPKANAIKYVHKSSLYFKDLQLSLSEWCKFGQNAISTFNESIDSLKGIKSSLVTGKVDEIPTTPSFSIMPMFTRVSLEDFDRYNWIKFRAAIEYPEQVEQIEGIGTHVDKSGFINYAIRLESVRDQGSVFSLDDTSAIIADLVQDTSMMMEALLSQFQRRIMTLVYGKTPNRPKFIIAMCSALQPEQVHAVDYQDGEKQENEINQIVDIAYRFVDLNPTEKLILGTNGLILVTSRPEHFHSVLSFYGSLRGLQLFQATFFARLRKMWDHMKDLRNNILNLQQERVIDKMEQELSEVGADIVLIEEVIASLASGIDERRQLWEEHSSELDEDNLNLAEKLEIEREVRVTTEKIKDMEMVSSGLVDEVKGLRDMLNTLAEKRMRELSKLMASNVQQGSDAQLAMAANVKASRYSGAALKILSVISSGALGLKLSDLAMKAVDDYNEVHEKNWEVFGSPNFWGGFPQVIFGAAFWIIFTVFFFYLINSSKDKMKQEKLAKDYTLNLRMPIDVRTTPAKIRSYIETKEVMFYNVEPIGHRTSWYHKEPKGEDKIFYTLTMEYDLRKGHLRFMQANTENKKGDARFTVDFLLKDLESNGLLNSHQVQKVKARMGLVSRGGG